MLNKYREAIIERVKEYVDPDYYNHDILIDYLCNHNIVESEVFRLSLKMQSVASVRGDIRSRFTDSVPQNQPVQTARLRQRLPDQSTGFYPTTIEEFLDRMPFYFFVNKSKVRFGNFVDLAISYKYNESAHDYYNLKVQNSGYWEPLYTQLDYLFYDAHVPLEEIFTYISTQTGNIKDRYDLFEKWFTYIKLCQKLGCTDYTPVNLLYSLNVLLEKAGAEPIIYTPQARMGFNEYFERTPGTIVFGGEFPVDPETGEVVNRWIGIWCENVKFVRARWHKSKIPAYDDEEENYDLIGDQYLVTEIEVGLLADTIIYAANIGEEFEENVPIENPELMFKWFPIYFGPKQLTFDFDVLKAKREEYKWKQEDVSSRIGVNIRTYQNWETHSTTPDAQNLLRLMNLFNIERVQDLMTTVDIPDPKFEKFRTGCPLSFFLPKKEETK